MKKKLALLLTVIMVFSMSITAFAAGSADAGKTPEQIKAEQAEAAKLSAARENVSAVSVATNGKTYRAGISVVDNTQILAAGNAFAQGNFKNASVYKLFDVDYLTVDGVTYYQDYKTNKSWDFISSSGSTYDVSNGVTLSFSVVGIAAGKSVSLIHQKHDGSWETIATKYADGQVTGTFTSLSPVGIVVSDGASTPAGGTPAKVGSGSGSGSGTAKATGENNMAVVLTLIAILSAGGFVITARKAKRA